MVYPVFCMRDSVTGFMTPTVDVNKESAIRNFRFAISRKDSPMQYSKNDYSLYMIGSFNTESGEIVPVVPAEFIIGGSSCE